MPAAGIKSFSSSLISFLSNFMQTPLWRICRGTGAERLKLRPPMERCGCCAASAWQKETPGYHRQPGAIIPYILLRFDPGDGSGLGAAPCVSDLACQSRHHSDRLAGLFTPFRRRDNTRLTLSHYLVVSTLTHPAAKYKPLFAIFFGAAQTTSAAAAGRRRSG